MECPLHRAPKSTQERILERVECKAIKMMKKRTKNTVETYFAPIPCNHQFLNTRLIQYRKYTFK